MNIADNIRPEEWKLLEGFSRDDVLDVLRKLRGNNGLILQIWRNCDHDMRVIHTLTRALRW